MNEVKIDKLQTETRNPKTMHLDDMTTEQFLYVMNEEDNNVVSAVKAAIPQIEKAVVMIADAIQNGGRLIYFGAGTSGRLGILDASECPPTFSTTDEVIGIIAGGDYAIRKAVEGAEDSKELAVEDLKALHLSSKDILCGLAASGRTPYVIGGFAYMQSLGGKCIAISCNHGSEISKLATVAIEVYGGPEVLTGSTRLKSGTSQKMVLNMLSTATMIRLGKTYNNLMVDVKASNLKLIERCKRIVMQACDCTYEAASVALSQCEMHPKTAIVMIEGKCDAAQARERLQKAGGFVKKAITL